MDQLLRCEIHALLRCLGVFPRQSALVFAGVNSLFIGLACGDESLFMKLVIQWLALISDGFTHASQLVACTFVMKHGRLENDSPILLGADGGKPQRPWLRCQVNLGWTMASD